MARIEEEQKVHGPVKGIIVALERTGSIISSCGIIMAGTFCSLMAGSLVGMDQLGLALAAGVLLDTFVIRPIMVPSMLILLSTGRLGILSRLGGFPKKVAVKVLPAENLKSPAA
jgi:RND superfamily putative drug exporter